MGKVVTSAGLNEFVSTGKFEEMKADPRPDKPPADAPPLEVKTETPPADVGTPPIKEPPPADEYKDEDPEVQARIDLDEKVRKAIGRQYAEAKSLKVLAAKRAEEISELERLAENQFNERRLYQQRADEAERQLRELQAAVPKPPAPELTKPDPQKFYDEQKQFKAFEYAEALSAYSAAKAVADHQAKQDAERQKEAAAAAEAAVRAQVDVARKVHADYDEVLQKADVQLANSVLQYLTASDHTAEIAYYMAKNPDYVARINKLNPLKAIAEIGKLELTFEKAPEPAPAPPSAPAQPAKGNGAPPPPITPLVTSGSGIVQTDPAKMNFQQLRAYERARQQKAKH